MNKRIQAEGPAAGAAPDSIDKPEEGKVYALTGGTGSRCIANGHSWAESEVKDDGPAADAAKE
jgi:hypothetical protein